LGGKGRERRRVGIGGLEKMGNFLKIYLFPLKHNLSF